MDIQPIKTEADYERVLAEINALWGAEPDTPDGDRLDILMTLVEVYETKHYPIDPPDPIDAILFRMEQQGLTRKDLEPILGSRSRVSEVLNRKRPLSLEMFLLAVYGFHPEHCRTGSRAGQNPMPRRRH